MTPFPEDVRRLLARLGGVEELEALLLLARTPDRYFSDSQVAAALRVTREMGPALERLARANLLDVKLGSDVLYRFVDDRAMLAAVAALATEYDERRLAVLEALRSSSAAKQFADAFRFRKGGKP